MSKYIFTKLPMANDEFDDVKLQMTTEAETLSDLIETFQYFLKGAGFHFDGNLEIVTEDDTESFDDMDYDESSFKIEVKNGTTQIP